VHLCQNRNGSQVAQFHGSGNSPNEQNDIPANKSESDPLIQPAKSEKEANSIAKLLFALSLVTLELPFTQG
jgi:CHAT domain-containing protein